MIRRLFRAALADRRGVGALEFALVVPIIGVMLMAIVDLGNVLFVHFRLGAAVASGSNYGLVRAEDISTALAPNVASDIARLVASATENNWAAARVTVNNGPVAVIDGGEPAVTTSNTAATNALCYCPGAGGAWGAAVACGAPCPGGGIAGRFVEISARRAFTPLFYGYGVASDGYITISRMVQTE